MNSGDWGFTWLTQFIKRFSYNAEKSIFNDWVYTVTIVQVAFLYFRTTYTITAMAGHELLLNKIYYTFC